MNLVLLSGYMAADPKLHEDINCVTFCMITNEGYTNKDNQWVERPVMHNLILSSSKEGRRNYIMQHGKKGRFCEVQAKLFYREYKDDDTKNDDAKKIMVASLKVETISFPVAPKKE